MIIHTVNEISNTSVCFQIVFCLGEVCTGSLANFSSKENRLQNFIALSVSKKNSTVGYDLLWNNPE